MAHLGNLLEPDQLQAGFTRDQGGLTVSAACRCVLEINEQELSIGVS